MGLLVTGSGFWSKRQGRSPAQQIMGGVLSPGAASHCAAHQGWWEMLASESHPQTQLQQSLREGLLTTHRQHAAQQARRRLTWLFADRLVAALLGGRPRPVACVGLSRLRCECSSKAGSGFICMWRDFGTKLSQPKTSAALGGGEFSASPTGQHCRLLGGP